VWRTSERLTELDPTGPASGLVGASQAQARPLEKQ